MYYNWQVVCPASTDYEHNKRYVIISAVCIQYVTCMKFLLGII